MNGGYMITRIRKMYALTEQGARGLIRASFAVFLKNFVYLLPAFLIMFFAQGLLEGKLKSPLHYTMLIVACSLIMYVIIYMEYNTTYTTTYRESANLRIEIANRLKELPLSYFSKHDISDLSQTVMKDVGDIEHALSHAIPQFIGFTFFFVVISIMLLVGNVKLGLCILIPTAITFVLLRISKKLQIRGTTKYYHILRRNSEKFQEAIELQQEIQSYRLEESVRSDLDRAVEEGEKIHIETEFAQAIPVSGSGSVLRLSLGLTIVLGTILYMRNEVSLLYLLGYILASARIFDGLNGLLLNIAEVLYIDARIQRINELRNQEIQHGEKATLRTYDIEFKDVVFSYDGERNVVNGVSFVAKQNQVTALVGPSGCGKTSVLRLMSRLYDYDKGQIIIDGKEIKYVDTDDLFEKISIVFQNVTLFDTSVMENIRIGNRNASDEEVMEAARLANCHEFIEKLPQGYQTRIGENGSRLSGGERQRISIARAFLKNAPIILLDEISASLDVENEMKIQESLNQLIQGKTVVIVSHRLKSIEKADQIIVMQNGKIEHAGTHDELMEHSALYRSMVDKANRTAAYRY